MKGLNRKVGAFLLPFVIGGGLPGVGIGVIWIPHYPAVAPTRVAACPVAPKKDSLLCKEVRFTQRAGVYISGPDWAETSVIGSQHIGAPKLGMGPRASNRFRRCSVSAVSGGGTAVAQKPYKFCRSHR